ncbi:MAG: CcmD family protein [Bacteroidia bacterium]
MKKTLTLVMLLLLTIKGFSQQIESFHENGKIYPVLAVILVILLGIFFFLMRQERKIKALENQINSKK